MASPYYPPPGSNPNDPVAHPNTNTTPAPAPAPPLTDPLAWVKSRIPVWQQTNPWIEHDTPEYLRDRIVENGGLNDPVHGADYWNTRMATPEPLWGAQHPETKKTASPYGADDPTQQSDFMSQIMEELRAQQMGGASPRGRQLQIDLLGRER